MGDPMKWSVTCLLTAITPKRDVKKAISASKLHVVENPPKMREILIAHRHCQISHSLSYDTLWSPRCQMERVGAELSLGPGFSLSARVFYPWTLSLSYTWCCFWCELAHVSLRAAELPTGERTKKDGDSQNFHENTKGSALDVTNDIGLRFVWVNSFFGIN